MHTQVWIVSNLMLILGGRFPYNEISYRAFDSEKNGEGIQSSRE